MARLGTADEGGAMTHVGEGGEVFGERVRRSLVAEERGVGELRQDICEVTRGGGWGVSRRARVGARDSTRVGGARRGWGAPLPSSRHAACAVLRERALREPAAE